jgi:peptide/nickel transport system permease protein
MRRTFEVNPEDRIPLGFFVEGVPYRLLGFIDTNIHLFGPLDPDQVMFLLGADRLGRDLLSRLIIGTRTSMTIGLVGVLFSLVLGVLMGGLSGYYGGAVDTFIQRLIEFLRSVPSIPLWMGLAAALPLTWSPEAVYFAITIILSFIAWTGLARVVRGRFLALREEDFVMAARLDGVSERRIIFRHMLPSFTSHIIAAITLAIPSMILAETALSYLGLGLREPVVSWGVLLQDAQELRSIATAPWLLIPAVALVISVLALNFLGDGLRDAADPYSR